MQTGSQFGNRRPPLVLRWCRIESFVRDDGGYTTLAMALALLVSVTMIFGMAAAQWSLARSADVQEVADAAAMAGENGVAAFSTVAQTLDACVLTMGLTGTIVCGAGLVVAAIPPLEGYAATIMDTGKKILSARRDFAGSSAKGLKELEDALPALIMANSASCVSANSRNDVRYVGMAVPFPQESKSDYSFLKNDVDPSKMDESAKELSKASGDAQDARDRVDAAKERAWRADNVNDPMCMHSRAETLAGLGGSLNPSYPSPDAWEFEYARLRTRNYYARRYSQESFAGGSVDELQRSAARKQFYGYAYEAVGRMSCVDSKDTVHMDLWELPHNTDMVRDTRLYTDAVWPCTQEEAGCTLHCSLSCPGATGPYLGSTSLSQVDVGGALLCETCRMDAHAMGNVASASTNIDNGYEHYWRIVVDASKDYEAARKDQIEAEKEMQDAADEGSDAFDKAMEALKVDRPKLCPPGAYGCVGVVARPQTMSTPTELTSAFVAGVELPRGAAVSAATLAPDQTTERNTVLARAFDGLRGGEGSLVLNLVGSVTGLWSDLLVGYGSAYGSMEKTGSRFLDGIEGLGGEKVATWLKKKVSETVETAGLEPADLRLRKPVLVNSQTVLDKAGYTTLGKAREVIQQLPTSPEELVALMRSKVQERLGEGPVTVAEIPVPGFEGVKIPLTLDLSRLGAVS